MPQNDAVIMDGKKVAAQIYSEIAAFLLNESNKFKVKPKLAIVFIGEDKASRIYIKQKIEACNNLGFAYLLIEKSENSSTSEIIDLVEDLNRDESVTGIIVQMPLPARVDKTAVIKAISPRKDVDGLHPENIGNTFLGKEFEFLTPCTATGIIKMLEFYQVDLVGKLVCMVGSGIIAGRPIAAMLSNRRATVTLCNSKTPNLSDLTKQSDIVVVAVGHAHLLTAEMIKPGAVVVDVGISRNSNGEIIGDADFDNLLSKAGYLSPVPGGVGKLTVACLIQNLIKASL